jgi:hypothetical protein
MPFIDREEGITAKPLLSESLHDCQHKARVGWQFLLNLTRCCHSASTAREAVLPLGRPARTGLRVE